MQLACIYSFEAELEHICRLVAELVKADSIEAVQLYQAKVLALDMAARSACVVATGAASSKSAAALRPLPSTATTSGGELKAAHAGPAATSSPAPVASAASAAGSVQQPAAAYAPLRPKGSVAAVKLAPTAKVAVAKQCSAKMDARLRMSAKPPQAKSMPVRSPKTPPKAVPGPKTPPKAVPAKARPPEPVWPLPAKKLASSSASAAGSGGSSDSDHADGERLAEECGAAQVAHALQEWYGDTELSAQVLHDLDFHYKRRDDVHAELRTFVHNKRDDGQTSAAKRGQASSSLGKRGRAYLKRGRGSKKRAGKHNTARNQGAPGMQGTWTHVVVYRPSCAAAIAIYCDYFWWRA